MCEISITDVTAAGSPNPEQIAVTVAVSDCKFVTVSLDNIAKTIELGSETTVTVVFVQGQDYGADRFVCDESRVTVRAECIDQDADCPPSVVELDPLPCVEGCPSGSIEVIAVGECVGGQRPVTLRATVVGAPDPTIYEWEFGNGDSDADTLTSSPIDVTVNFPAGGDQSFTSSMAFLLPSGCDPIEAEVGPFEQCPVVCPEATVTIVEVGDCVDGKREVTFKVEVTAADDDVSVNLGFGDGTFGSSNTVEAGQTGVYDESHPYEAPGADEDPAVYDTILQIGPTVEECPPEVSGPAVTIEPCGTDCAGHEIELTATVGECGDDTPTRPVTVEVSTDANPGPTSYTYTWSDGTEETSTDPSASHTFASSAAGGESSVAVDATWANGCEHLATVGVDVQRCDDCPDATTVTATEGTCTDGGERAITLQTDLTGTPGGVLTWDFGDGTQLTSEGATSPPHVLQPGTHTVSVSIPGGGSCEDVDVTADIEVTECPEIRTPPPPRPPRLCEILRILGLILLIIGLVLIFGGACAGEAVVIGIGVAFAVVGFVILVLWAFFCVRLAGGCFALQRVIEILQIFVVVLGFIALILGIFGVEACAIGALVDTGIVGVLLAILGLIFQQAGCRFRRPSLLDSIFGSGG